MALMLRSVVTMVFLYIAFFHQLGSVCSKDVTLVNNCRMAVWPGIQANLGSSMLAHGGLFLPSNSSHTVNLPPTWSGRFWGRSYCSFDTSGHGSCATGDCGRSFLCNGAGGTPPATLAEFTFGDMDFYDVSLVDGYNIPMSIKPIKSTTPSSGRCVNIKCSLDLRKICVPQLQVRMKMKRNATRLVACKSACLAFNTAEYCCTGPQFQNPQTCKASIYSKPFKKACPTSYSYAYDDRTSIATCSGASTIGYTVIFCPSNKRHA